MESIYRSYTLWPLSEPTKLLYHPKQKPRRGPQTDKQPAAKFHYRSIVKKSRHLGLESIIYLVLGSVGGTLELHDRQNQSRGSER